MKSPLVKIISGGQTGADIAAVDAAISHDFPYGGMLPKGRRCEGGIVPSKYTEFSVSLAYDYTVRTKNNIMSSDGTLVFSNGKPTSGTKLTITFAKQLGKPYMVVDIQEPEGIIPTSELILQFVQRNDIKILNVAGPRESKTPGIHTIVFKYISHLIERSRGIRD